jgi:arsenate reductase (thioredoxin)
MEHVSPAPPSVLFICLHGSAKSLIAAEYFNRLAEARGVALRAESAGVEPDSEVPPPVIAGLRAAGIDVQDYIPRHVTRERVSAAMHVVSFGCDVDPAPGAESLEEWRDLPMASDGFEAARDAIVTRVEGLLDKLTANR